MFCKHKWSILDKVYIQSEAQQTKSMGYRPRAADNQTEVVQTILSCEKCGKLKRFTVSTGGY